MIVCSLDALAAEEGDGGVELPQGGGAVGEGKYEERLKVHWTCVYTWKLGLIDDTIALWRWSKRYGKSFVGPVVKGLTLERLRRD